MNAPYYLQLFWYRTLKLTDVCCYIESENTIWTAFPFRGNSFARPERHPPSTTNFAATTVSLTRYQRVFLSRDCQLKAFSSQWRTWKEVTSFSLRLKRRSIKSLEAKRARKKKPRKTLHCSLLFPLSKVCSILRVWHYSLVDWSCLAFLYCSSHLYNFPLKCNICWWNVI